MLVALNHQQMIRSAVNSVAPVVSGTTTVGSVLTVTNGTWTGIPTPVFTRQWQRNGVNIAGATAATYTLVSGDLGVTIRAVVTATNARGAVPANSNGVGPIT